MKRIFKYQIELDTQSLAMPIGAKILTAQEQNGRICIWAIVNPTLALEERTINVYGTGMAYPMEVTQIHLGTVQLNGFVWHIFEEKK